jgi:tetratricopeptide (TPR) repeat protein
MTEPSQEQIKSLEERLAHEPLSPLFARLAAYYLGSGRAKDALRMCDDGLAHYPFYSTAHLIKGNALVKLGMMAEAKHEYEVVRELVPTSETATRLWSGIDLGIPSEIPHVPAIEETAEIAEPPSPPLVEALPAVEESIASEPAAPAIEEIPHEEITAPEESVAVVEEPHVQEPSAEEPQPIEQPETPVTTEDAFGLPVEPSVTEELPQAATDFGFGTTIEPTPQAVEETPFGETPVQEPQAAADFSAGQVPEASPEPTAPEVSEPATETPAAEQQAPDWFEAFSQLQQSTEEAQPAPQPTPAEEENPFAAFGSEQPTPAADAGSYEDFTARMRMELFGTENTMTLEEYLSASPAAESGATGPDQIGELTEKLKSSQRITPPVINFAEKSNRTSSDVDATSESGFVTPTLAEIYVKQGWYDDAIKAYRTLAANKPEESQKYGQRIAEIEEMRRSSK